MMMVKGDREEGDKRWCREMKRRDADDDSGRKERREDDDVMVASEESRDRKGNGQRSH